MSDISVTKSEPRSDWASSYGARLLITDAVVVVWATFGSQIAWFGFDQSSVWIDGRLSTVGLSYTAVSVGLSAMWILFLSASGSRDKRVVGLGSAEYARVIRTSVMLFGLLAIASYLTKTELARGYFITALPLGLLALLLSRWMWRQYLIWKRSSGELSSRVILVGSTESCSLVARDLISAPASGYHVVGAFTTDFAAESRLPGTVVPLLGSINEVESVVSTAIADTFVVTGADGMSPERLRRLSWSLEPGRQHLVVAPGLMDVAGPRIHIRPVAGLPLVHVETPRYEGAARAVKRGFDIVASASGLLMLAVPFLIMASAVKMDGGPVFFRQERVGKNGNRFRMLKFRSMIPDADKQMAALSVVERTEGNEVMFKLANDPRITRVGGFLRRYSLDELPQLVNVLRGDMSLVGPRPPLPREVEQYEAHVNRRFLVKPGITGLWQVSGRSDLDWETSVRLDLFYVENWSLTRDMQILAKTLTAVLRSDGAY